MSRTKSIVIASTMLASLVVLSSCGGGLGSSGEAQVVFATTGGTTTEALQTSAYEDLKEAGIEVLEETPNDHAKLTAMTESNNATWDVYHAAPYDTIEQCGVLYEKIDFSKIEAEGVDLDSANECGVPFLESNFVLAYNADTYGDNPPKGWKDFYDPDFPGERGIMNYPKDMGLETALLGSGVSEEKLYPLDLDRAFDTLDGIRDKLNFFETGAEQQTALANGTVDMMLAWPTRLGDAKAQGANIEVSWNQPISYSDAIGIVKGAPHQDEAYELVNAILNENSQKALAERMPITPVNKSVAPSSNPKIEEFLNTDEKSNGTTIKRNDEWWGKNREMATERWTNWVNK
jgi:putative spermidine/putrescine transport system substrate-binding protein